MQENWQEQCNPQTDIGKSEMIEFIQKTAKDATYPLFFRPGVRAICMHTMANLLVSSQSLSFSGSSSSSAEPEKSQSEPPKPKNPKRRTFARSGKR